MQQKLTRPCETQDVFPELLSGGTALVGGLDDCDEAALHPPTDPHARQLKTYYYVLYLWSEFDPPDVFHGGLSLLCSF